VCAFTTWLGIGLLVLARHPALFSVGLTALLGMSFSLAATLFLVPTGMDRLLRRRLGGGPPAYPSNTPPDLLTLRRRVARLYRYQGPYVEQYVFWKLRMDPLFQAVDAAAPRTGHILDVGCGYGLVAHWLIFSAPERALQGLDHDGAKLRVARATATGQARLTFEQADLLAAAWPACDTVLLCDVLHYFPRELKARILQRAAEALRPGGCLIVRDACSDVPRAHRFVAWSERFAVWIGHNQTEQGLHFETAAGYESLLRGAGFAQLRRIPGAGLGSNIMLAASQPGPGAAASPTV